MLSPGYKTGRWTLVDIAFKRRGESVWNVVCDCGNTKQVPAGNLKSGKSGSCGCLNAEVLSARSKTHGLRSRPVYAVWNSMRQRCQNPNSKQWPDYGGRGITVCDTWNTFENFYADMGEPPSPEGCLDRVDNDKDYSKENCRWTTRAINNLNRRNTVMVFEVRA